MLVKDTDALIAATRTYVKEYMSHCDASHDYSHIQRVLALAQQLTAAEEGTSKVTNSSLPALDRDIITLACLLHDVGDRKYLKPCEDGSNLASTFLLQQGAAAALAETIQTIVNHVSFTSELKDPRLVEEIMRQHPELAIVQDADRLDAMGAVGIGRAFTYNAVNGDGQGSMERAVLVMEERLLGRERWMKTAEGKRLAREKVERIRCFQRWWRDEVGPAVGLGDDL